MTVLYFLMMMVFSFSVFNRLNCIMFAFSIVAHRLVGEGEALGQCYIILGGCKTVI